MYLNEKYWFIYVMKTPWTLLEKDLSIVTKTHCVRVLEMKHKRTPFWTQFNGHFNDTVDIYLYSINIKCLNSSEDCLWKLCGNTQWHSWVIFCSYMSFSSFQAYIFSIMYWLKLKRQMFEIPYNSIDFIKFTYFTSCHLWKFKKPLMCEN